MGDRYVLGFELALRFLRGQILCRLYKSPSGETIDVPRVSTHIKRSHTQDKDHVVHVRVLWIMETPKYPSMHLTSHSFYNAEIGHYTREKTQR